MGFGGGGGGFNNGGGFSGGGRGGGRGGGGGGYQQGGFGGGGGYGGGGKGGKGGYDNSRGRGRGSRGRGRQYDSWGSKGGGKGGGGGKGASATLPKNLKKLSGHTGTVTSIDVAMEKEQFFSGSADGSVKVWSWANASFENTVTVNAGGPVECVLVFYPWLFAGTTGTTSNRKCVCARLSRVYSSPTPVSLVPFSALAPLSSSRSPASRWYPLLILLCPHARLLPSQWRASGMADGERCRAVARGSSGRHLLLGARRRLPLFRRRGHVHLHLAGPWPLSARTPQLVPTRAKRPAHYRSRARGASVVDGLSMPSSAAPSCRPAFLLLTLALLAVLSLPAFHSSADI